MNRFPTLERIIGHPEAVATLQGVLARGRPGHAYLFQGPNGIGKKSVALALAQTLFCRTGRARNPVSGCGHCPPCQRLAAGNHPDLVLLTKVKDKTRIGVDQVRELSAFLALTPLEGAWKVAVVDDAAWMTEAAANALLKTLEEPPSGSLLILVSNRPGALTATIRSRCLKIRFNSLDREHQLQLLAVLSKAERAVLERAVELAGGDLNRALNLCEEESAALQRQFFDDLRDLSGQSLATLCDKAEYWSHRDRFSIVTTLLRGWFQRTIHDSVGDDSAMDRPGAAWLELFHWVESLLRRAVVYNLNRRLVLEAVFIRLARLKGVSY